MIDNTHTGRRVVDGDVDFSMMHFAHDAFARHLDRLSTAVERGVISAPSTAARWALFSKQLHIHHTAEDVSLWPSLRAAVSAPDEVAVLDAMEYEHAQLDPRLELVEAALAERRVADAAAAIRDLAAALAAHMRHEENEALPLVATYLGAAGWGAFTRDVRKTQGLRGAAVYLPWLVDGAPDSTVATVLGLLPPPVRLLYRRVWAPRYRKSTS
jgi:hemerythrin-like domain-containing protein